ncbi:MAG: hypothetical protein ABI389_10085 [Rhodanobacter sp.]
MVADVASGMATETPDVIALIDPPPLSHGHALVLPRQHVVKVSNGLIGAQGQSLPWLDPSAEPQKLHTQPRAYHLAAAPRHGD